MSFLEGALVLLILIWTVIFIFIAIAVWYIFRAIKKTVDKVDHIVDEAQEKAEQFDLPMKIIAAAIMAFMTKNSAQTIKKIINSFINSKKK